MPEQPYDTRLGLVGCGYWGKNLARNLSRLGALHSICEADRSLHPPLSGLYPDVRLEGSFDALLADSAITQVAIASPAALHYRMAKQALQAGKDVFVEKPICLDCEEAHELKCLAIENNRILMVGHLLQYHPAVVRLRELVEAGTFGRLFRVTSNRLNLGKVRSHENALWSLAPHDISVVLSLLPGHVPVSVQARAEEYLQKGIADCFVTTIRFTEGLAAQIHVSWLHPFKDQRLCVIGERAMAVFDDTLDWAGKLVLRRHYLESPTTETIELMPAEPLEVECRHFLDCCRDRSRPRTDADEGIRVLQILAAAQASANAGGISFDLDH